MTIFSKPFIIAAAERALKTGCQVAATTILANATGLLDADWVAIGSVSGLAAVVSVLTSIASGAITGDGPSLTHAETIK